MPEKKKLDNSAFHSAKEETKHLKKTTGKHRGYTVAFMDQEFLFRDELRPVRLQLELLRAELVLQDKGIDDTIVFFGSARLPEHKDALKALEKAKTAFKKNPKDEALLRALEQAEHIVQNSAYLEEATHLAKIVSQDTLSDMVVVTGGGPSFMAAANKGAHEAGAESIAFNMMLPDEQKPNAYVTASLTFQFHYFAIRKMHFLMRAKALIAFPGGFGTLDELFESLTLIQTQKIKPIPLILFNQKFWKRVINFEALVQEGTISASDLDLIQFVETAEQAWDIICRFYKIDQQ